MSGHTIHVERTVAASPTRVWAVITDLGRAAEVLSSVERIELLTPGPYAVGTTWRETRRMLGRSETEEMTVAEVDPERSTVITAESSGARYRASFTLTPRGTGTRVAYDFSAGTPDPSIVQRLTWLAFGPIGAVITKRAMNQDLTDIAAAAEGTS